MTRRGLLAGGNFIIDHVKLIDSWPQQDTLATILSETSSNGGGPYNVLKDLCAMAVDYPLEAVGLVGDDANGAWIIQDCSQAGIGITQLQRTTEAPTSYTDAMTVASSGRRTFFHQRGSNALLGAEHFDFSRTSSKLFHLGYLMLLDEMDRLHPHGGSVAADVLQAAQREGLKTSVDLVSAEHAQFREIVHAALPVTDYLFMNEIEAGRACGMDLRDPTGLQMDACVEAARHLLAHGVREQVIIHFAEGAVTICQDGSVTAQGSLILPAGFVIGATGAGDAFAAGYLHGLHERWPTAECLRLGVAAAAMSLRDATPSQGLAPIDSCLDLHARLPCRTLR
jgi:sugar/nucleoside kinase (ribokinase family)